MSAFVYQRAESPVLVSIPHTGLRLDEDMLKRLTTEARDLPDTDWHVDRLYDFLLDTSVGVLRAEYSRYVVDLNRSPESEALYPGQLSSDICPTETFAGDDIYQQGLVPTADEVEERIQKYWSPYHACIRDELDRLRQEFGFAILWDAHSIRSRMPRLFDGVLPHLNIGTNEGASCDAELATTVTKSLASEDFTTVVNGRFVGGYITRHYGNPAGHLHAIQLEVAQRTYMNEVDSSYTKTTAEPLRTLLRRTFDLLLRR